MPLICLSSPKGGVGKSTLTANLAFAMQRLGHPVALIDFDVQNALRLHLGLGLAEVRGFVAPSLQNPEWHRLLLATPSGIRILPYGAVTETQQLAFENHLQNDPSFLREGLRELLDTPGLLIIADTPPGPSPALTALNRLADLRIAVLLADAASASLLPSIESGRFYKPTAAGEPPKIHYILNQVDQRRRLNRDVTEFIQARLGSALLGLVHRDEALPEALACQQSVFAFDPSAASAYDIDAIARRLAHWVDGHARPAKSAYCY